jgi:hypothetical protein
MALVSTASPTGSGRGGIWLTGAHLLGDASKRRAQETSVYAAWRSSAGPVSALSRRLRQPHPTTNTRKRTATATAVLARLLLGHGQDSTVPGFPHWLPRWSGRRSGTTTRARRRCTERSSGQLLLPPQWLAAIGATGSSTWSGGSTRKGRGRRAVTSMSAPSHCSSNAKMLCARHACTRRCRVRH